MIIGHDICSWAAWPVRCFAGRRTEASQRACLSGEMTRFGSYFMGTSDSRKNKTGERRKTTAREDKGTGRSCTIPQQPRGRRSSGRRRPARVTGSRLGPAAWLGWPRRTLAPSLGKFVSRVAHVKGARMSRRTSDARGAGTEPRGRSQTVGTSACLPLEGRGRVGFLFLLRCRVWSGGPTGGLGTMMSSQDLAGPWTDGEAACPTAPVMGSTGCRMSSFCQLEQGLAGIRSGSFGGIMSGVGVVDAPGF